MVGIGLAASLLLTTTLAHGDSFPFANKEQGVDYRTQNSEDGKKAASESIRCAECFQLNSSVRGVDAGDREGVNTRPRDEL